MSYSDKSSGIAKMMQISQRCKRQQSVKKGYCIGLYFITLEIHAFHVVQWKKIILWMEDLCQYQTVMDCVSHQ